MSESCLYGASFCILCGDLLNVPNHCHLEFKLPKLQSSYALCLCMPRNRAGIYWNFLVVHLSFPSQALPLTLMERDRAYCFCFLLTLVNDCCGNYTTRCPGMNSFRQLFSVWQWHQTVIQAGQLGWFSLNSSEEFGREILPLRSCPVVCHMQHARLVLGKRSSMIFSKEQM